MIDALIQGRIYGQPTQRNGKNGKPFALAKVRASTTEGESQFVSVIAFDDTSVSALLALNDGDSVAVVGPLKVSTWQDKEGNHRPGLDLVAHQVMSLYAVRHKRTATQEGLPPPAPAPQQRQASAFVSAASSARAPQSAPPEFLPGDMEGDIPF